MMVGIVRELDPTNTLPDLEPIDVARGLVSLYDRLPDLGWAERKDSPPTLNRCVNCSNKPVTPTVLIFDDIPRRLSE